MAIITGANAVEAARQHMDQEAADELMRLERHGLVVGASLDPVILPPEGHALVVGRNQPAV